MWQDQPAAVDRPLGHRAVHPRPGAPGHRRLPARAAGRGRGGAPAGLRPLGEGVRRERPAVARCPAEAAPRAGRHPGAAARP